ncbi:hypothetical protein [Mariniblastus fucicola]|uniref:DUF4129 domain-containing protein n=1 Tax=Mariniblastus fucicola TaxID=980251 RepID=A0A5B9PPZ6_9BACT|nr:hypothetical protein [Mariniblastus fucicola]QEG24363.1 hypothetical protein MFFC18_42820 [Mariniblastus fucicola]
MKSGIWKKICLGVLLTALTVLATRPAIAQDSFREFDRKLVATPAELYDALSWLHPQKQRAPIDPQRLKDIEKAGRDFLSKLSPEQQDKAWEFAEKYLRKNGVDAASSQKLLQEFGLPPEMQNELTKQFRKFGNRRTDPDATRAGDRDDEIGELLRKAREQFERQAGGGRQGESEKSETGKVRPAAEVDAGTLGANPARRSPDSAELPQSDGEGDGDREGNEQGTRAAKEDARGDEGDRDGESAPSNASRKKAESQPPEVAPESPFGQPETAAGEEGPERQGLDPNGRPKSNRSSKRNGEDESNRSGQQNREKATSGDEAQLDQLLKQLDGLKKQKVNQGGPGSQRRARGSSPDSDLEWEKLIENLAENRTGNADSDQNGQPGNNGRNSDSDATPRKNMLGRAQELISNAFNGKKGSAEGDSSGKATNGTQSNERVGSRFDRLLVKAVDRTLAAQDEDGVSEGVSGMLGSLIERFQNRESESEEQASDSQRRGSRDQASRNGQNAGDDRQNDDSIANSIVNQANRNSDSLGSNGSSSQSSNFKPPRFETGDVGDLIPDLSGVDPTHVFTFFAIVGVVLFVVYLATQSFVGDGVNTKRKTREVIRRVRNTTMRSPKDLVETVDMFLLAKFGIKSSWWNAKLARRILHSSSPELQGQVDDLFRDYVRARYMRRDIQIPDTDQQRYRETLEALSKLDIRPNVKLPIVPKPPAADPAVSLEG